MSSPDRRGRTFKRSSAQEGWPRPSKPACRSCASRRRRRSTQARIDSGQQAIIGVNRFRPEHETPIQLLKIDNAAVRQLQIEKLSRLRRERDPKRGGRGTRGLARAAAGGNGNLLALAIDGGARQGDRGRDFIGARAGLWPPYAPRSSHHRRLQAGDRRDVRQRGAGAGTGRRSSRRTKAAGLASWSPRSDRTVTTAARR